MLFLAATKELCSTSDDDEHASFVSTTHVAKPLLCPRNKKQNTCNKLTFRLTLRCVKFPRINILQETVSEIL